MRSAPTARTMSGTTRAGSTTAARGTNTVPAGNRALSRSPTATANRVLPIPPGPVSVINRRVGVVEQLEDLLDDPFPPDQRGRLQRERAGASGSVRELRKGRHGEPFAEQHGEVVADELGELLAGRERPVGLGALGAHEIEHLHQASLDPRGGFLHVQQPGRPTGQLELILQPGDLHARPDPPVPLPVEAHEDVALHKVPPRYSSWGGCGRARARTSPG